MWMGGPLPLGYDVRDRLLVVNEAEAALVRRIFDGLRDAMRSTTLHGAQATAAEGHRRPRRARPSPSRRSTRCCTTACTWARSCTRGRAFPASIKPILTSAQWDAVHALIARTADGAPPRHERSAPRTRVAARPAVHARRRAADAELHGQEGQDATATTRRSSIGALVPGPASIGPLPARAHRGAGGPADLRQALSAPHIVQSVWDRLQATRADISEPEVVLPMRQLATMWQQLFPVEQCRLAQLLIERVVVADGGLEIVWRDAGLAGAGRRVDARHHRR